MCLSPACRKRRLNRVVSRNNRIKRLAPCRLLNRHVKEPYEMSMALEARPYVQLLLLQSACTSICAVTYMTEISLIVTFNNNFTSTRLINPSKLTLDFSACDSMSHSHNYII